MPGNAKKRFLLNIPQRKALRAAIFMVVMALISLSMPLSLNAGTSIVTMDVGADNPSTVSLTINATSITFPSADPGVVSKVPANENAVTVTASATIDLQSTAVLTVLAAGDLVSGTARIPINNVTWTATGDGFVPAGTMSKDTSSAGSWQGPGDHPGTFSFFLANSWSYAAGNYSQTITYTLTVP